MIDLCLCDWSYTERQVEDVLKVEEAMKRQRTGDTKAAEWGERNRSMESQCSRDVSLVDTTCSRSNSWNER